MKLEKFIEMLKEYPMDAEVYLNHPLLEEEKKIFQIYDDDGDVIISSQPYCMEDVAYTEEKYGNVQVNVDDTFYFYSRDEGDVGKYTYDEYTVKFKNKIKNNNSFDEYQQWDETNLTYVGGLRRFLSAFPENMKININSGEGYSGIIHQIKKSNICYLVGTYDYVEEECEDELFIEYGIPVSSWDGGGSFPLKDNAPWTWTDEINSIIAQPIIDYFTNNNEKNLKETLTSEESKEWGGVVEAIKKNLLKYYRFTYQLNGSWDSNGYFHPYDEKELYVKPPMKKEIQSDGVKWQLK